MIDGYVPSDDEIVNATRGNSHVKKQRFSPATLRQWLDWLRRHNVVPAGKARACLAACVAIAWKREVYVTGVIMAQKEIDQLAGGEALLGWRGEGIWFVGQRKWRPEDMALKPESFREGIDREISNYGITSGLGLWLDLQQQGLMDTGIGADFNVRARQLFRQEFEKYQPIPSQLSADE